jgi:hypothetical protein
MKNKYSFSCIYVYVDVSTCVHVPMLSECPGLQGASSRYYPGVQRP